MSETNNTASSGLQPNVAGLLCYLLTWVTGIIFLIIEKNNKFVRFHAFQSIIVFGVLWLIYVIFIWTVIVPIIIWIVMVISWIFLMIKAYQGKMFKVPLIGNWAEKLANGKSATSNP